MQGRGRIVAAVITALVIVAVSTLATVVTRKLASGNPGESGQADAGPRGPRPPARGAYLGSWVQPWMGHMPEHRSQALREYEEMLGRRLDIAHFYRKWNDDFPAKEEQAALASGHLLLISWAGAASREVTSGRADAVLRDRARRVRDLGVPVFLRWRWEMDRKDLRASAGSPEEYIAAWKHARRIFAEEGATNAGWVWCPTAWGFRQNRAAAFYPGDDQVDWLCADAYSDDATASLEKVLGPFLAWSRKHATKPIMIGEYGAVGTDQRRATWLRDVGQMARRRVRIKALVYFDSDFRKGGRRWSYTLRDSPASLEAYRGLLADPFFNPRRLPVARDTGP